MQKGLKNYTTTKLLIVTHVFFPLFCLVIGTLLTSEVNAQSTVPYDLENPSRVIRLPKQLKEISGLTLHKNGTQLLAIQDEDAKVYCISIKTNEVQCKKDFGKGGDFEALEMINDKVYVIKSDGDLYEFEMNEEDDGLDIEKCDTKLKHENDVEGMTYDPTSNCLLLACKARPKDPKSIKDINETKGIYAFNLREKKLNSAPAYLIALDEIRKFLNALPQEYPHRKKLFEFYQGDKLEFSPSAIAIHPLSDHIYITSSKGKQLIVLNPNGKISSIVKLNKKVFPQPEGLAFLPDGTLFISTEGKEDCGMILKFDLKQ